jgi:hypothetical protein
VFGRGGGAGGDGGVVVRLKQLLNGPAGGATGWIVILSITFVVGMAGQWLMFSDGYFPDGSVMLRWPILWITYFLIGYCVGERATRWVANRLGL